MVGLSDLGAGMLVIDHFSQILGEIDENTSRVAEVMKSLRGLAESLNLALVLIHHQVKGITRFGISSTDALRGHGSILASCDMAAVVERQALDPAGVNVRPVALRGPNIGEFAGKFSFETKTDGSLELQSARFFGVGVESVEAEVELAVVEVLKESPNINQTALRGLVAERVTGAGDPVIRKVLSMMEQAGKVKVKSGKQNSKLYRLDDEECPI